MSAGLTFIEMAFSDLPNEIIIEIVENLDKQRDIASVIRIGTRFHFLFHDYLYRYNITYDGSYALFWAAKCGQQSTARKMLHMGAEVDVKKQMPRITGVTPLHITAYVGHLTMVDLFLEAGANPKARVREAMTPLYPALVGKHEEVVFAISRRTSNLSNCLVDSKRRLTPLHVASQLGLWRCARYFLENGVDVNAKDVNALTPLHHALIEPSRLDNRYKASRVIKERKPGPEPEDILKTVKVLLEFNANQDRLKPPMRKWGSKHSYHRVSELFPKVYEHTSQISRTRMLSSNSERSNTEHYRQSAISFDCIGYVITSDYNVPTYTEDKRQPPENLDLSSFPVLDSPNQSRVSGVEKQISDSLWSPSRVNSLIARLSVADEPDAPLVIEESNLFPPLSSHSPQKIFETEAGKIWASFGERRGQSIAEEKSSSSSSCEKKSPPVSKCTKARSKNRWQQLDF